MKSGWKRIWGKDDDGTLSLKGPGTAGKKAGRSPGSQIKEFYEESKEALSKRPLASDCPAIITEVFFLSQHFCAARAFRMGQETAPGGREFGRPFVR